MLAYRRHVALLMCLLLLTSGCARHRLSLQPAGSVHPFAQQPVDAAAIERLILGHVKTSVSDLQLERVKVLFKSQESREGIIGSVRPDSFTLHAGDRRETIAFRDVAKVERARERLSGGSIAAIVAGVGMVAFGVIALLILSSD